MGNSCYQPFINITALILFGKLLLQGFQVYRYTLNEYGSVLSPASRFLLPLGGSLLLLDRPYYKLLISNDRNRPSIFGNPGICRHNSFHIRKNINPFGIKAAPSAAADVSLPPRPIVVISPFFAIPWNPATTTTPDYSNSSNNRSHFISRIFALV